MEVLIVIPIRLPYCLALLFISIFQVSMVLVSSVKDTLSACVPQTTKCIEHQLGTKKKTKMQHNIGNTDSSTSVSLERGFTRKRPYVY